MKRPDSMSPAQAGQKSLPVMPEWCMTDIMPDCNGLDQILVQPQVAPDCPGDLGDQLYVQHSMRDMVVSDKVKNLCFVDISAICEGMQYPVHIHGEVQAIIRFQPFLGFSAHPFIACGRFFR